MKTLSVNEGETEINFNFSARLTHNLVVLPNPTPFDKIHLPNCVLVQLFNHSLIIKQNTDFQTFEMNVLINV